MFSPGFQIRKITKKKFIAVFIFFRNPMKEALLINFSLGNLRFLVVEDPLKMKCRNTVFIITKTWCEIKIFFFSTALVPSAVLENRPQFRITFLK